MITYRLLGALVLAVGHVTAIAQEQCPPYVQHAIAQLNTACVDTERNTACYANGNIEVVPQPNVRIESFNAAGDKVTLTAIESMALSAFEPAEDLWGLSVLKVQASIPDTLPGQNVTILLTGDTQITNDGVAMEAFTFANGIGAPGCASAPNGLIIQTPEGVGEVTLTANNIEFSIGSTLVLNTYSADALAEALESAQEVNQAAEPTEPDAPLVAFTLVEGTGVVRLDGEDMPLETLTTSVLALDPDTGSASLAASFVPPAEDFAAAYGPLFEVLPEPLAIDELTAQAQSGDDAAGSGGDCAYPISGLWRTTVQNIDVSLCPVIGAMMTEALTNNADQVTFVDFGDSFSPEAFLSQGFESLDLPLTYDQPDACTIVATYNSEGGSGVATYRLESQDRVTFDFTLSVSSSGFSCTLTYSAVVERVGD
jgi:hypothetical protein